MARPNNKIRTPKQSTMSCIACGSNDVVEIEMTLADGTAIEFRSCHDCENRWWDRDGEPVELAAVLKKAAPKNR